MSIDEGARDHATMTNDGRGGEAGGSMREGSVGASEPDAYVEHELVGVTTEQNTANLVPAVLLGVRRYVGVESTRAARDGWGDGLAKVFEARYGEGTHARIALGETDGVEEILGRVRGHVSASPERPRAWCLGGGTKRHQVALWRLFVERFTAGHVRDVAVYAEPAERRTYLMRLSVGDDGTQQMTERAVATEVTLTVPEILAAFGREAIEIHDLPDRTDERSAEVERFRRDPAYRRAWLAMSRGGPGAWLDAHVGTLKELVDTLRAPAVHGQLVDALSSKIATMNITAQPLLDDSYRRAVEGAISRKGQLSQRAQHWKGQIGGDRARLIADESLRVARDTKVLASALSWTTPTPIANPFTDGTHLGRYFESLVAQRVADLRDPRRHPDGRMNVKVRRVGGQHHEQEHDVLLATSSATLLSLDAKTFDLEVKDMNSRILKTRAAAGRFASFVVVFPYFVEDFDGMEVPEKLRDLPFHCAAHDLRFVVISSRDRSFHVRRSGAPPRYEIVDAVTPGDDAVRCETLEDLLGANRASSRAADPGRV